MSREEALMLQSLPPQERGKLLIKIGLERGWLVPKDMPIAHNPDSGSTAQLGQVSPQGA